MYRHPHNPNLTLIDESEWNGLPLLPRHGPYIDSYLARIWDTVKRTVEQYRRVTAIRFDLRMPDDGLYLDSAVISRFIESLKAKLVAAEQRKARQGIRVHPTILRTIWVREQKSSHHPHYHVCILLNGDAYCHLGFFGAGQGDRSNMATRIQEAWASALGIPPGQFGGLVHFPPNRVYRIDANSDQFLPQMVNLFTRLSYFAKVGTKQYGTGDNCFGCSRR
ncbi:hypothetical protein A167_00025 [Alcanivorax sp. S71-1-4]|uniref:inovirus Gp2 family protein n=1 Tax=Alcanivorax sp. S71-1-4 TaxID=1177159 RepID=UPI001359D7E6|nr:inovirus Gp2 family protein [Alcanivorax sp. S71-1-4]KAF0810993.1 hypothetical protein A167_00025 [Alcanivorax sp. S71-1-4]